jgi:hypothetical protein
LAQPVSSSTGGSFTAAAHHPARRSEPEFDVDMTTDQQHARRTRQWRVRCHDVANRERFLTVFVEHGMVVLVGPPGESAVFSPAQLGELRSVLHQAADEAERLR